MISFAKILKRAEERKGGAQTLKSLMPKVKSKASITKQGDDRCLAMMTKCVFQAGFVWKVIENKWPDFEAAFLKFQPKKLLALAPEKWEAYAKDTRIVRNMQKILSVRDNARFVVDVAKEHGSFAKFVANWPNTELVDLFTLLKKRGARLGGMSGQRLVRLIGKDGFILTEDVVACLKDAGVKVAANPISKQDLQKIQNVFNQWHEETNLPYSHLSRIAAYSIGKNFPPSQLKGR
jgi:3-methyladenine DNA glycosylase Tag